MSNDNEKEITKLDMMQSFITNCAQNIAILLSNIKEKGDNVNEIKVTVADYCLMFNHNLKELIKELEKEDKNGSVEH